MISWGWKWSDEMRKWKTSFFVQLLFHASSYIWMNKITVINKRSAFFITTKYETKWRSQAIHNHFFYYMQHCEWSFHNTSNSNVTLRGHRSSDLSNSSTVVKTIELLWTTWSFCWLHRVCFARATHGFKFKIIFF